MENLLAALRAAGEPTRLRILGLLGHGELTVSELVELLRQSQPRVSRHLKLLVEAGLLARFREGTWVFYRLVDGGLQRPFITSLLGLIEAERGDMVRDLARLAELRQRRAEIARSYFRENASKWDEIRRLYVADATVEQELIALAGDTHVASVLDVGTGTGRMLELFADKADKLLGVDLSREMLAVAREGFEARGLSHIELRSGDMYELPVDDNSQDIVIFHQVLHYSDEPTQAIREAARSLKKDGSIVIADFAPHELEYLRDEHAHRRLGFADSEVKSWARASGLVLGECKTLSGDQLDIKLWRLTKTDKKEEASDVE